MENKVVAIIDDDEIFVYATKRLLELSKVFDEIFVFKNGKVAIERLTELIIAGKNIPDTIFLDLNMPVLDGWGFLDEFLKLKISKPIKLYIVSSSINPVDHEKATTYSAVSDFIIKPITKEKLKEMFFS